MVSGLVSDILFGFTGLISIIKPFGIAFVFLDHSGSLTNDERRILAKKVAINALCVLIVAFFAGTPILHLFGIDHDRLTIVSPDAGRVMVDVAGQLVGAVGEDEQAEDRDQ